MLKSALKLGLNFDTDGDGKPNGRLSIDPKEFSFFSDDKKSKKELTFIFDDLERTNIELSEILGYINYLVEQSNFKVIVLANEEEIKNKDDFLRFKEKVIGKTFEVRQDLDATFSTFIAMVTNSSKVLTEHKELIKEIFNMGNYDNLRHIRQTILDFEYFYNQLDDKFKKHDEIIRNLLYEFFVFSIEIKSGTLNSENFKPYDIIVKWERDEKEETPFEKVMKKHSLYNEYNLLLTIDAWKSILIQGNIDKNSMEEILNSSKYLMNEQTESWRRLWEYRDLEDDEFKSYLKEVVANFDDNKYKEQGKLLHVIALLLYFSKAKMYQMGQDEIMKKAKENIKSCIESEKWDSIEYDNHFGGSACGLGFIERESNNMQKILTYFKKEIDKSFDEKLKNKAKVLLQDFQDNNLENLKKKLQQEFYQIPILSQINIDEFVSMFQNLKHKNIYDISRIIKKRYENTYNLEDILSEEKFWKSVNHRILKDFDRNDNPVKYNLLKSFKEYTIKEILQKFQENREHLEMIKTTKNDN